MSLEPQSIEELQAMLRKTPRLLPRGGGSKPSLSTPPEGVEALEMNAIAGVLEYEPHELTFTALAGTCLAKVNRLLSKHGQYLPFDPPLAERGATLGGTVASGLSGSGRYHYGGVRDFLLGVRFVDSQGELVRGGGKVVKNAAGFDLPKLMIGSRGSLGVLVELSFKVFPRPQAYASLRRHCADLDEALQAMQRAASIRLDVDALDLELAQDGYILWVRLGGLEQIMPTRLARLAEAVGECQEMRGPDEEQLWRLVGEFAWVPAGWSLVKVPLTPGRIPALEVALARKSVLRRYIAGGQAAWLALEAPSQELAGVLETQGLSGLALFGPPEALGNRRAARLGEWRDRAFYQRVRAALDPVGRFVEA